MTNLITVKKLSLSYPAPTIGVRSMFKKGREMPLALNNVSFTLGLGERLAIIGLNGSGKSTLLRTLAGIYTPSSGFLEINGSIAALFSLGIGMKLELSGRTNILLQGMMRGLSRKQMLELMPEIIEFSELESVIDDPIHTYSQGMAVRLSFSIATATKPDILLLDEWIGAGDSSFRIKAQKRIEKMVGESHGMILASHNTNIVEKYCQTALWMDDGQIRNRGQVTEVLNSYRNFVQQSQEKE